MYKNAGMSVEDRITEGICEGCDQDIASCYNKGYCEYDKEECDEQIEEMSFICRLNEWRMAQDKCYLNSTEMAEKRIEELKLENWKALDYNSKCV